MVLYKISSPMNRYRKRVMIGCLIGMVITSISMKNLFSLTSVSPTALLLLAILFFAADSTFQHLSTISEKVQLWFYKKKTLGAKHRAKIILVRCFFIVGKNKNTCT